MKLTGVKREVSLPANCPVKDVEWKACMDIPKEILEAFKQVGCSNLEEIKQFIIDRAPEEYFNRTCPPRECKECV